MKKWLALTALALVLTGCCTTSSKKSEGAKNIEVGGETCIRHEIRK